MRIHNHIFIIASAICLLSCIEIFKEDKEGSGHILKQESENLTSDDSLLQIKIDKIEPVVLSLSGASHDYKQMKSSADKIQQDIDKLKQNAKLIEVSIQKVYDRIKQDRKADSNKLELFSRDKIKSINSSLNTLIELEQEIERNRNQKGAINALQKKTIDSLERLNLFKIRYLDSILYRSLFQGFKEIKDTNAAQKTVQSVLINLKTKTRENYKNEYAIKEASVRISNLAKTIDSLSRVITSSQKQVLPFQKDLEQFILNSNKEVALKIKFLGSSFRLFIINADSHVVKIHVGANKKLMPLEYTWNKLVSEKANPLMVTNAGMYNPDGLPVGLYIANSKVVKPLDENKSPIQDNFHLYPNGVFFTDSLNRFYVEQTTQFAQKKEKEKKAIQFATQSGPMLIINDNIHPSFNFRSQNVNIRNGIGVMSGSKNQKAIAVISDNEVTFYQFALLFKYVLNCNNALYLDGAISKMYSNANSRKMGDLGGNLGPVLSVSRKVNEKK